MGIVHKILIAIAMVQGFTALAQDGRPPLGRVIELEDGSFLKPLQERDSVLIADQLLYGFTLDNVPEGTQLMLPDFSKGFRDSIEVVSPWLVDTVRTIKSRRSDKKLYDLMATVVITSFDEGNYDLPQLAVQRILADGTVDTLVFPSRKLDVRTIPIDTTTFQVHDIKGQMGYPLTFKEILPYLLAFYALAVLIILTVCLIRMRKKAQDGETVKEPPYVTALRKLEKYRGNRYWAPEKQKIFYSGITDALREYIVPRFGVDAVEMTTADIFASLDGREDIPADLLRETRSLFERADFVKFAKYVATEQENSSALPDAVRFVTTTYQSQPSEEQTGREDAAGEGGGNVL